MAQLIAKSGGEIIHSSSGGAEEHDQQIIRATRKAAPASGLAAEPLRLAPLATMQILGNIHR